ncbi:MAG TPA: PASTA domain-containing protein [Mycobacteriales bacterium]|nr:PASTA domain-containing protein [Mycobacteriales bacterium]
MSRLRILLVVAAAAVVLSGCDGTIGRPGSATATGPATVPAVTGKRLDDAERTLRDAGFSKLKPVDASSADRAVLDPNNWIVKSQTPAAGTRTDRSTAITLKVTKPTDPASGGPVTEGTVPSVVCEDLQSAQDALQSAGFFNLGSADGTGKGRAQIVDRNWVVIKQSVRAGQRPDKDTRIVLTSVKYGEPTGDSGCKS